MKAQKIFGFGLIKKMGQQLISEAATKNAKLKRLRKITKKNQVSVGEASGRQR